MPTFREDVHLGTKVPLMKTDDYNDQSVTEEKIKDGNITTKKIADDSVTTPKIVDQNVTTAKIADGNVTTVKIADQNVTTDKIADLNVTTEKLVDSAVVTDKIADYNVTTRKIQDSGVTTVKIADQNITTEKIANGNVTTPKIANGNVTTEKIKNAAIITEKIEDKNIVNSKLDDSSVNTRVIQDNAITTEKIQDGCLTESKLSENSVTTNKIKNLSVTTEKISDKNVTNEKIADDTITLQKFDADLRMVLNAATGMPDDLLEKLQDVSENIAELQDSEFPITLGFSITPDLSKMSNTLKYSVSCKGAPFMPDTLMLEKQINDSSEKVLVSKTSSSGTMSTSIEGAWETFKLSVTKNGRTSKSTSLTRYLCYYGASSEQNISETVLGSLSKVSATGVSFNPSITTQNGNYIWLVVPSYLTISRVTSAGFDVTLAEVQTITTSLGTFKAYRTANSLTENKWNLVIS